MGAPGFWDEPETAQKTAQAVTQLKEEVETFRSLETRVEDMEVLCELALEEDDESLLPEMEETLASIRTDVEHLELGMLLITCRCWRNRSAGLDFYAAAYVFPLC